MIELVDYETYCTMSPEDRMLQKLQALGEILSVSGWGPMTRDEAREFLDDEAPMRHGFREAPQRSYMPISRRILDEGTDE